METIVITGQNILQGISLNEWSNDAGYSPKSKGINPLKEKGVINFMPSSTSISGLEGNVVASIVDPNPLNNDAYILDDEGKFYTLVGTTLTKRQTDATNTYQAGTSDIFYFKDKFIATSTNDIILVTGQDLETSLDATWWSVTLGNGNLNSGYRHPMEVVEDTLYIADKNKLHTWDGSSDVKDAMTLPDIYNITALHTHPNGRDLIAFCAGNVNYSGTQQTRAVAFIINTVTLEYTQMIELDDMVTAARLVGGILYVVYANKLGYFTDTGIQYLRDLNIPTTAGGDELVYKHHIGNMAGHLLICENKNLLAFGDLGAGKVFWYPTTNYISNMDSVLGLGGNSILFGNEASGNELLLKVDLDDGGVGVGTFYSNKYNFPSKIWVRKIEVEHSTLSVSGEVLDVGYVNNSGSSISLGQRQYSDNGAQTHSRIDCNVLGDAFTFYVGVSASGLTIRKITIYYEYAEQ